MTSAPSRAHSGGPAEPLATEQVLAHLRRLIERGQLRPGQRLPAERGLAKQLGVSRSSLRAGLRSLAAMRVLETRHGAGTFISDGPPTLGAEPLRFLAALHRFAPEEMFEARRMLEIGVAGLAAERARPEHLTAIAEEVTECFASLDDPQAFLIHDIRFHRAIAAACGNPILAAVVGMVSALFYERRRPTASRAHDRREPAELHRRIYQAIRARDRARAEALMNDHLLRSQKSEASERIAVRDRRANGEPARTKGQPANSIRGSARRVEARKDSPRG